MDFSAGLQDPTQTFQKWYGVTQPLRDMRAQEKQDALNASQLAIAQQTADLARQKAEAEAKRKADLDAAAAELQKNDTAENRLKFLTLQSPENVDKVSTALNSLDTTTRTNMALGAGQVVSAIKNGHPEMAWDQLQSQADGYRAAGQEDKAKQTEALIAAGKINPDFITNYYGSVLAYFPEGQKVWDQINKNSAEPHNENLTDAQAELARAQAQEALANAVAKGKLPESAVPAVNALVDSSLKGDQTAKQYSAIADQIDQSFGQGGLVGKGWEAVKGLIGGQDAVSLIKAKYASARATGIMGMLPPGSASDKDVALAQATFPSEDANPKVISSFLRGMAKINQFQSARDDAESQWRTENRGSSGPAQKEFEVNGKTVKPGTKFTTFVNDNFTPDFSLDGAKPKTATPAGGAPATPAPATPAAPQKKVTVDF